MIHKLYVHLNSFVLNKEIEVKMKKKNKNSFENGDATKY